MVSQNKSLQSDVGQSAGTEQSSVREQISQAKAEQKADAKRRARLGFGAAAITTTQSEVAEKPPVLYQPPKINTPADLGEVARLMQREFEKIAASQSYLLTLWKNKQDNPDDSTN
ncbi:TPA: hypothetical protein PCY80_000301 [Klebsiella aerogenes]|nr:hypothetical protein [Klebsiella aerogenes]